MIFLPSGMGALSVKGLESDVRYRAFLYNPVDGTEIDLGPAKKDDSGDWPLPQPTPIFQDWVLVLENMLSGKRQVDNE